MHLVRNAFRSLNITYRTMSFYAVARGHKIGIYDTWAKCEEQVKGFKGAKYKKFTKLEEAESFIELTNGTCKFSNNKSTCFSPQNVAVPLGKKGCADWKEKTSNEEDKEKSTNNNTIEEFWPDCDGDNFEDELLDTELVAAMTAVEESAKKTTEASEIKLKRKGNSASSYVSSKVAKIESKIWEPVGVKKIGGYEFQIDSEGYVIVYTDGSCINNGTTNARAGFGVYFGENHKLNTAKPVNGRVTNNVGEIQAAIYAIKAAIGVGVQKLCISTDSQFLIRAITGWVVAWKRKNWRLKNGEPVKNVVDFKELDQLLQRNDLYVKWNYVKAHKGIKGNEMADKLAREGSDIYGKQQTKE